MFDFITENNLIPKLRLAKELGFTEMIVLSKQGNPTPTISGLHTPTALLADDSIKSLGSFISRKRKYVDLVAIASASRLRLIKSIQDDKTDLIIPDLSCLKVDKSIISLCKRHDVSILFPLKPILKATGIQRSVLMKKYSASFQRLGRCKVCLGSLAESTLDLRSPPELIAFFHYLGMPLDRVKKALDQTPKHLVKRNKDRQKLIAPGILRL